MGLPAVADGQPLANLEHQRTVALPPPARALFSFVFAGDPDAALNRDISAHVYTRRAHYIGLYHLPLRAASRFAKRVKVCGHHQSCVEDHERAYNLVTANQNADNFSLHAQVRYSTRILHTKHHLISTRIYVYCIRA